MTRARPTGVQAVRCEQCGTQMVAGARFCAGCGRRGPATCAGCGALRPDGARYCATCGAPVGPDGHEPARREPARSDPDGAGPVAERRLTSVLFADLVGFTARSEGLDPEDVRELLSGYFEACRAVVDRYGGTVEKFIGDAVMAVWGVPRAHEDDAERAVRAGLDLVEAVGAYGDEHGLGDLALRVGVVTGEVAVTLGAVGEGMVAGDAVNLAARVQGKADPGRVWVDEQTRSLTAASIAYGAAGAHLLRGRSEPVDLFAATAVVSGVGGTVGPDRVTAPLVGRRRLFAGIRQRYHETERGRRANLLVVSGEAGAGKSRLGWELYKYLDGLSAPVRWHWTRCLAYGDGVAFSALSAMVRARIGVEDGADEALVDRHLRAAVDHFVPDPGEREWLRTRVGVLLGIDEGGFEREDLFAAWLTWIERVGEGVNPVVWVIDDAHHADAGFVDFVEHVLTAARSAILMIVLARPTDAAAHQRLAEHRRATVAEVGPLDDDEVGELLDALVRDLPADARRELIRRAAGLPLYAVETVRSLLDRGVLVEGDDGRVLAAGTDATTLRSLGVPAGLRLLCASRLDNLEPADRDLLQQAAVLGVSFTVDALAAATSTPVGALAGRLAHLVDVDLLSEPTGRADTTPGQYRFVQELVREVAYATQSRRVRARRHEAAATYLETNPEAAGELAAVIARHLLDVLALLRADDDERGDIAPRAVHWSERAARRAEAVAAYEEAFRHYETALRLSPGGPATDRLRLSAANAAHDAARFDDSVALARAVEASTDDVDGRVLAAALQGLSLRGLGRSREAEAVLAPYDDVVGDDLGAASMLALARARALSDLGRIEEARPVAERALRLAEASGVPRHVAAALNGMALNCFYRDLPRLGRLLLGELADLARREHLAGPLALALSNQTALAINHEPEAAVVAGREGVAVARQSGRREYVISVADNLVTALTITGRWAEVDALHAECSEVYATTAIVPVIMVVQRAVIAEARGEPVRPVLGESLGEGANLGGAVAAKWADFALGLAARADGDPGTAAAAAALAVAGVVEREGLSDDFTTLWVLAVEWAVDAGDLGGARALLEHVTAAPGQVPPLALAELPRLRGTIDAGDPAADPDGVEADLRRAVAALGALGATPHRARAEAELAAWLTGRGAGPAALDVARSARRAFAELGARAWADALRARVPGAAADR